MGVRIIVLSCLALTFINTDAKVENFNFRNITVEDGLPSSYISSIAQDQEGFMWFGTAEGLSRYDGYTFLNFSHLADDTLSLINNDVRTIVPDNENGLWIGTQKGLNYLNLETYCFERFTGKYKENIGAFWINTVCLLDNENILVGTFYNGLVLFNHKKGVIAQFIHDENKNSSLANNTVNEIIKDKTNNIWIATSGGIDRFNPRDGSFEHVLENVNTQNICLDFQENIVATAIRDNYIYTISGKTLEILSKEKLPDEYNEKPKKVIYDKTGNRWLGILDGGLLYKDYGSNAEFHWKYSLHNTFGISTNSILTLYEDKNKNLWIGTFDGGIDLIEHSHKPFIQVKSNYKDNGLQSNHVRTLFQDKDGDIWVGTKSIGMLSKFNRNDLTFQHFKHNPENPRSLNDEFVLCIEDAEPGYLWVGTLTGGLNHFEKQTGKFTAFKHKPGDTSSLMSNAISSLFNDNGKLYIGHVNMGLDLMDMGSGTITHYRHYNDKGSLSDNRVRVIFKDSGENIWIGTMSGLNKFNSYTKTFTVYLNNGADSSSLSDNNIFSIAEDHQGKIWIGTGTGFNAWDPQKNNFKVYNQKKGFLAKSARCIQIDAFNKLWISTDNGIVKYDPAENIYSHYIKDDGLVSNEFSPYSSLITDNGEMMFGSDYGFVVFNPESIKRNPEIPGVVFTDFKLFNQTVNTNEPGSPLKKHITKTKEITLSYKQTVLTLGFSAINYASPKKNQYAYKMEGFDKDWTECGSIRYATYTNLPSGDYIFKVKASNNDGVWNENGNSIKISVLPPPWKTWWAYSVYFLIIIFGLYKYRDFTVKRLNAKKEHEMDQMKIQLFMNVSHEFRTPLTLMILPLKKLLHSEDINSVKTSILTIQTSTWKLLNLVNQLLDFRKLDMGGYKVNYKYGDIINFTRQLCQLYEEIAESKNIELRFSTSYKEIRLWIDPDKYEKIISNLLSNAIKFTESNGEISVSIEKTHKKIRNKNLLKNLTSKKQTEFVEIRVRDTGIGIETKDIRQIFNRFYQVDQLKAGTGIGLNFVKSLVELHHGEIEIESEKGVGSCFIVRIPIEEKKEAEEAADTKTESFGNYFNEVTLEALEYDIQNSDITLQDTDTRSTEKTEEEKGTVKRVILVVEDNKSLRRQIADELSSIYLIKEATDGMEGLEKAQKYLPDLIISDIMMPKTDGIELCKRLKEDISTCHIPVIILTAKSTMQDKIQGFETGADEYLPKPFSMELLMIRIKNLIASREMLREKFVSSKVFAPAKEYTTNNLDEAFLEKATAIVMDNIENPEFAITDLREKMGVSRTNLFNKIQSITGQNPSGFIRTIRLKYAAQILNDRISIKNVSYDCGFNSTAYFIKTFREFYGMTPRDYVEEKKKKGSGQDTGTKEL